MTYETRYQSSFHRYVQLAWLDPNCLGAVRLTCRTLPVSSGVGVGQWATYATEIGFSDPAASITRAYGVPAQIPVNSG